MASFKCDYCGGPLDGDFECRPVPPRDGDLVHRMVGSRYVKYVFNWSKFAFVFVGYSCT
jgi:hypothetical protein